MRYTYIESKVMAPKQNPGGQFPILPTCRLSVRCEDNQLNGNAVPVMPYHVDKRVMRTSWSIVSNGADRYKNCVFLCMETVF